MKPAIGKRYVYYQNYCIYVGRGYIKLDEVMELLRQTYWADKRSKELTLRSINHSRCYGVRDKDLKLVGFARVITDYATTYYLCDVVIEKNHQHLGLGKELMRFIIEDQDLSGLSGMLVTENAHHFYEKFGFVRAGARFMQRVV